MPASCYRGTPSETTPLFQIKRAMPTIRIIAKGKVQGVHYRASARKVAEGLGITGWVRNLPNGSVEAVATGTEDRLAKFIEWCRTGPSGASVSAVDTEPMPDAAFKEFAVRPS